MTDHRTQLVRLVILSLAATAGLLSALILLMNRTDWWRGLLAAGVASGLSAVMSVPPLLWSMRRGINERLAGAFAAAGIRAAVSIGGAVLAVKAGHYPAAPTMLMMVVFYFAVLAAETYAVSRSLWNAKST